MFRAPRTPVLRAAFCSTGRAAAEQMNRRLRKTVVFLEALHEVSLIFAIINRPSRSEKLDQVTRDCVREITM